MINQSQMLSQMFFQIAPNGLMSKVNLHALLQQINFNPIQIESILSQISDQEINYQQFMNILRFPEQTQNIQTFRYIPQQQILMDQSQPHYQSEQIQSIYDEFKQALKQTNYDKTNLILNQYKDLDLPNMIDQSTKQISTFIIVQQSNETQSLHILNLLYEYGANLNFKDSLKQTILFYICRDGKIKLLDFILQTKQININEQDIHGQTSLFYAARENKIDIVTKLVQCGINVNIIDTLSNQTALFYSAREGHVEICKILIDNGCDPYHLDSTRKNAIFFSKKFARKEVVDLFSQYANKNKEDGNIQENSKEELILLKSQKKKIKDLSKQSYKLIYTDEDGNQQEISATQFNSFQINFPSIANLLLNADELIDDNLLNSIRDEESWEKIAKKVIQILWKSKGAYLFHQPVDEKKYGITDYYKIVTTPMDFGTIKQKLNNNQYNSCQQFYQDVMLVFENCILYNGSENEVGQAGIQLQKEFLNQIEQTCLKKYLQE